MFVEQVMTRAVRTVAPEASVTHAWNILREGGFRHLPVAQGERLVGMVSDRDLRTALARAGGMQFSAETVGRLARTDVVTAEPATPIEEAARLMLDHKIGALPVVEGGRLVGIVTESDLFRMLTRVMGACEPSTRLQLVLDHPTRQLADVTRLASERGVEIVSLVTEPDGARGTRTVVVRVGTISPELLIRDLEHAGIRVAGPVPA